MDTGFDNTSLPGLQRRPRTGPVAEGLLVAGAVVERLDVVEQDRAQGRAHVRSRQLRHRGLIQRSGLAAGPHRDLTPPAVRISKRDGPHGSEVRRRAIARTNIGQPAAEQLERLLVGNVQRHVVEVTAPEHFAIRTIVRPSGKLERMQRHPAPEIDQGVPHRALGQASRAPSWSGEGMEEPGVVPIECASLPSISAFGRLQEYRELVACRD
jgi:hypothetical protein